MPRYCFHVGDSPDRDGLDLCDAGAARAEAPKLAGGMIRDAGTRADPGGDRRVTVADGAGLTLFTMAFSVAEPPEAAGRGPP